MRIKRAVAGIGLATIGVVAFQNCDGFKASQLLSEGILVRESLAPLNFPDELINPSSVTLKRAFANLPLSFPIFLTSARDGSNRLFVVERAGKIKVFPNRDTVATSTDFLDISARVSTDGEQGFLGLAFSPDYKTSGHFYVHYSPNSGPRRSTFSRFTVSANDPNRADPASEKIILEVTQPTNLSNHKGGTIAFGPDGYLYIGLGDGGGGGDPLGSGQNLKSLLGKMLRIDPRNGNPYSIPTDNPYYQAGGALCNVTVGVINCPEIYAYGLRNPFRWSFDRLKGDLWVADVGQNVWEEIDIVKKGNNLGWNAYEGNHLYGNPQNPPAQVPPIFEYDHGVGQSITGGYVYRGEAFPTLRGSYLYGDFVGGQVWALVYDGQRVVSNTRIGTVENLASFGEDDLGEIYAVNLVAGTLWRLAENPQIGPIATLPQKLSDTGLFKDTAALEPASGLIEYTVTSPLWSDGAEKKRYLALPNDTQITFSAAGNWDFPLNTTFVKHFEVKLTNGNQRRLETRVLVRMKQGWTGFTYKWNAAGTDADLALNSSSENIDGRSWYFPSTNDCMRCHTSASGFVLGARTAQLGATQLNQWNQLRLFSAVLGNVNQFSFYVDPKDVARPVAERARSYLAANCAMCHQPGGPTSMDIDFRYETPLAGMKVVNVPPTAGDLGLTTPMRLTPTSKERSVIWERLRRTDTNRMPPLATSVLDADAITLIGQWIDQQ